ncbi:MAG: polyphosphate kinase 1, partial [Acidobacteriota bacterium]|nr:polyphosphate kinase 1 [Acidobacteriota bacterium]
MSQTANKIDSVEQTETQTEWVLPDPLPPSPEYLFNRHLSLMEFFKRVLDEGFDEAQPLLERLKFLAILSSILDEYFTTQVRSLKGKRDEGDKLTADGMTAEEQLTALRERFLQMIEMQMNGLHRDILPALAEHGIAIVSHDSLTDAERQALSEYFRSKIYPLLAPQAVDSSHPFPYISGDSLNLGLMVKPKVNERVAQRLNQTDKAIFMRIKIPPFVKRFVPVGEGLSKFVLVEDLITSNIKMFLPEAEVCCAFRIARDADNTLVNEETKNLLETMTENLKRRRFGAVVKLEISRTMPKEMVDFLTESLEISEEDVYFINGALKVDDFMDLYKLKRPDLKSEPLFVTRPAVFDGKESTFDIIKRGDVLLHHPYHHYDIVTDFIAEAVEDPDVLAIKMCVYRTGANSPIPPLLMKASELGKQVTVLLELKARFDEEANIAWAKRLEEAGVHVIYGLIGMKTHCKTTLIMRREGEEIRRYSHIATGNYNPDTAALYTDLGLLTDD